MTPLPVAIVAAALSFTVIGSAACRPATSNETAQAPQCPPPSGPADRLPDAARARLLASLQASVPHASHVWRDMRPVNDDGTVNVYVEIARGSSEKWEFNIAQNRRLLDRMTPAGLGGYPSGYGFVPATIGVDGDPFDGLVVGPPAPAGEVVRGYVLGFMHMTDEKGSDGKIVVTSEPDANVRRTILDDEAKARIADFFNRYKAEDDDPATYACVPGWGDEQEGRRHVAAASRLFEEVRTGR